MDMLHGRRTVLANIESVDQHKKEIQALERELRDLRRQLQDADELLREADEKTSRQRGLNWRERVGLYFQEWHTA